MIKEIDGNLMIDDELSDFDKDDSRYHKIDIVSAGSIVSLIEELFDNHHGECYRVYYDKQKMELQKSAKYKNRYIGILKSKGNNDSKITGSATMEKICDTK